jgi:hypothetical protein
MGEYGHDTYLINAAPSQVVLVPVHGAFWHDGLEICANRERSYGNWGQWCWNDVLVVRRGSCAKRVRLRRSCRPLPGTRAGRHRTGSPAEPSSPGRHSIRCRTRGAAAGRRGRTACDSRRLSRDVTACDAMSTPCE